MTEKKRPASTRSLIDPVCVLDHIQRRSGAGQNAAFTSAVNRADEHPDRSVKASPANRDTQQVIQQQQILLVGVGTRSRTRARALVSSRPMTPAAARSSPVTAWKGTWLSVRSRDADFARGLQSHAPDAHDARPRVRPAHGMGRAETRRPRVCDRPPEGSCAVRRRRGGSVSRR